VQTPEYVAELRQKRLAKCENLEGTISSGVRAILSASMSSKDVAILEDHRRHQGGVLVSPSRPVSPIASPAQSSTPDAGRPGTTESEMFLDKMANLSPRTLNRRPEGELRRLSQKLARPGESGFGRVVNRRAELKAARTKASDEHSQLLEAVLSPQKEFRDPLAGGSFEELPSAARRQTMVRESSFWWPTTEVHPKQKTAVAMPGQTISSPALLRHPKHTGQITGTGYVAGASHNIADTQQSPHRDRHLADLRDMPVAFRLD
jgi:hypothetical protein